jgi:hypothetical protein
MKKTEDYTLLNLLQKISGRSDLNSVRGCASKLAPYSAIRIEFYWIVFHQSELCTQTQDLAPLFNQANNIFVANHGIA